MTELNNFRIVSLRLNLTTSGYFSYDMTELNNFRILFL